MELVAITIGVASYGALGHVPRWLATTFFQLTSELHKVYSSQLYLVSCLLSLWKRVKSATRGVLSRPGST